MRVPFFVIVVLGGALLSTGCTHRQLRWNTVNQSNTLTEIYEQQVLDNLAMFVHSPGALPSFSYPSQGAADVTDRGDASSNLTFDDTTFMEAVLNLGGSRQMSESWTLAPVTDPRRLELMRCAYQQAIVNAGIGGGPSLSCPDCERINKRFYLGSPDSEKTVLDHTLETGNVTSACLASYKWFGYGCKKCVPDDVDCLKVGHYCGTYVWVCPHGQEELTKLTLAILDYAISTPASPPPQALKEVIWYLDERGKPTKAEHARQVIRAMVPYEQDTTIVPSTAKQGIGPLSQTQDRAFREQNPLRSPQFQVQPEPFAPPPAQLPILQLEQSRRFLTPQPLGPPALSP